MWSNNIMSRPVYTIRPIMQRPPMRVSPLMGSGMLDNIPVLGQIFGLAKATNPFLGMASGMLGLGRKKRAPKAKGKAKRKARK